jgi:hypothetical protein
MTRRQRTIAEEETPFATNMIPPISKTKQEKIDFAEKRIEELRLLIKHWKGYV